MNFLYYLILFSANFFKFSNILLKYLTFSKFLLKLIKCFKIICIIQIERHQRRSQGGARGRHPPLLETREIFKK